MQPSKDAIDRVSCLASASRVLHPRLASRARALRPRLLKTGEEGFEPPTPWSVATCSSPLSYTPSRGITSQELNSNTDFNTKIGFRHDIF